MNIPIQNIYWLLCYAWNRLDEKEIVDVDALDTTSLADLFARVLGNGVHHLIRRGLDRGYLPHEEWTTRPRGRIDIQELARRASPPSGRLPCAYDDLCHDVLHNRILKATMRRLLRFRDLEPKAAEPLAHHYRTFAEVSDIEVTSRLFNQVELHRNNYFYGFLLQVCELIHQEVFVSEETGAHGFMDFVRDRMKMATLYEDFVRRFYEIETPEFKVQREDIQWKWTALDAQSRKILPEMHTDVSITSTTGKLIIECKFTPEATKVHHDAEKLRSAHLYQLHAYMQNLTGQWAESCRMMLLYPTVNSKIIADYECDGRTISIRTIDLNQPWQDIRQDLLELVAPLG